MHHTHFSQSERLEISILLRKGYSHRTIGKALGCSQSSISREIQRNSITAGYEPRRARTKARERRKNSKYQGMKVEERSELRAYVINKMNLGWTPEQIAGRLKEVDIHLPYISAKGIYKWLYSKWGQIYCFLLPKQHFKPRKRRKKKTKRVMIPNRVGIENRPVEATARNEVGHFEADTMLSGKRTKSKTALAIICDRKSRLSILQKIPNLKPSIHANAQKKMARGFVIKTLTYDNGIENKNHEEVAWALQIETFFCNPYSSWEKGTVENTIGRIRRFIPKGADVNAYSSKDIARIQHWLQHTPRKCLNFKTPYEIMQQNLPFISPPK